MAAKPAQKDTLGYWMVNSNHIYIPSEGGVKVEHENIVSSDSGRDEAGYMHITWVRSDVRKVSLTYDLISGDAVAEMVSLMQGKTFNFTYYDNGVKTMSGYCGKNSYTIKSLRDRRYGGKYVSFSINVEEM